MTRRKTLRIPLEGHCAGHPCDDCDRCKAGDCCGNDVGEAGLPLEGTWPYEHFGVVGVLRIIKSRLQCHCCGELFENLARHVIAHNLTVDSYKALWGLNSTQPLVSSAIIEVRRQQGLEVGNKNLIKVPPHITREQRSQQARAREARAQTKLRRGEQPRSPAGTWAPPSDGVYKSRLTPKGVQ